MFIKTWLPKNYCPGLPFLEKLGTVAQYLIQPLLNPGSFPQTLHEMLKTAGGHCRSARSRVHMDCVNLHNSPQLNPDQAVLPFVR